MKGPIRPDCLGQRSKRFELAEAVLSDGRQRRRYLGDAMRQLTRSLAILAGILLVVGLAACAGSAPAASGALPIHSPTAVTPAPIASAASSPLAPTPAVLASTAASPTSSSQPGGVGALLEGTWSDGWHDVSLEVATVKAAGLDPTGPESGDWFTGIQGVTKGRNTIRFQAGQLVLFNAADGGPDHEGWAGTYTVRDDHTIVAVETDAAPFPTIVYKFTLVGPVLTMRLVSDTDPLDVVPQTAIYDTLPFMRETAGAGSGSPSVAPAASSASSALPDGTYRTGPIPVAAVIAANKAAGTDPGYLPAGVKSFVFTIRLQHGQLVQFESDDGGPDKNEWSGAFQTVGNTVITTEHPPVGTDVYTYTFTLTGGTLTLHFVSDTQNDPFDMAWAVSIYDTAPFVRQP
jgi:hypothetical protein